MSTYSIQFRMNSKVGGGGGGGGGASGGGSALDVSEHYKIKQKQN